MGRFRSTFVGKRRVYCESETKLAVRFSFSRSGVASGGHRASMKAALLALLAFGVLGACAEQDNVVSTMCSVNCLASAGNGDTGGASTVAGSGGMDPGSAGAGVAGANGNGRWRSGRRFECRRQLRIGNCRWQHSRRSSGWHDSGWSSSGWGTSGWRDSGRPSSGRRTGRRRIGGRCPRGRCPRCARLYDADPRAHGLDRNLEHDDEPGRSAPELDRW